MLSERDAHSREAEYVANATALDVRVPCSGTLFLIIFVLLRRLTAGNL